MTTRVSMRSEAATNDDQPPVAHGGVRTSVIATRVVENYEQSQCRVSACPRRVCQAVRKRCCSYGIHRLPDSHCTVRHISTAQHTNWCGPVSGTCIHYNVLCGVRACVWINGDLGVEFAL